MKVVELPEPPVLTDIPLAPPWSEAAEARNWQMRARLIDSALLDSLALGFASNDDTQLAIAYSVLQLTAVCEREGDPDIRSADAAVCFLLSAHAEWRAAAAMWFHVNDVDADEALDRRSGLRLLHAALAVQRIARTTPAGSLTALRRRYERSLAQAAAQGLTGLAAAARAISATR